MGLIFKDKEPEKRKYELENTSDLYLGTISTNYINSINKNTYLKLATVNRCVELISNSVASLPLIPYLYNQNWKYINYDTPLYNILNVQPNEFMSAYIFKKMLVQSMLLSGNAYVLINRNTTGTITSLELLNPENVSPEIVNGNLVYNFKGKTKTVVFSKEQIVHILNQTTDGIIGKSTLEYAADTLQIAGNSEKSALNWFTGAMSGILSPKAGVNITDGKAKNAKDKFTNSLTASPNSVIVLDSGFDFQPINHSAKEVQLLESRNFNIVMIASFFGVPPSLAFSQGQKFSTAEQEQLSFLNSTLTPLLEKLESELFRKLFLPSEYNTSELKFDVSNLLRTDLNSQADYYTKMFNIGAMTVNEIRDKINAPFPQINGNKSFIQVNLQDLSNLIYNQTNQTDNKLK